MAKHPHHVITRRREPPIQMLAQREAMLIVMGVEEMSSQNARERMIENRGGVFKDAHCEVCGTGRDVVRDRISSADKARIICCDVVNFTRVEDVLTGHVHITSGDREGRVARWPLSDRAKDRRGRLCVGLRGDTCNAPLSCGHQAAQTAANARRREFGPCAILARSAAPRFTAPPRLGPPL